MLWVDYKKRRVGGDLIKAMPKLINYFCGVLRDKRIMSFVVPMLRIGQWLVGWEHRTHKLSALVFISLFIRKKNLMLKYVLM